MGSSEAARLCEVTGVRREAVDALGALDDRHYAFLCEAFENARDTRERELSRAIDKGLTMVPGLVRPMVRRILFS
ncbi:hypothetical protein [Nocardia transvalensis]|uniref:hypothetical protein n=1 Tax=Nocardia transvalensis TaxID=37333 RepID=UPI0018940C2E|nr:hypothetical protein [Nocardia transvalensis]MBF6328125.1 hypothetical protein [Nocardia transvalensis]